MRRRFQIQLVCGDANESILLTALLESIGLPVEVVASGRFPGPVVRRDCVVIDARLLRRLDSQTPLSRWLHPPSPRQKALVVHFGAELSDPLIVAHIRHIEGPYDFAEVDKRARGWAKLLANTVQGYFIGQQVLDILDSVTPRAHLPVQHPLEGVARRTSLLSVAAKWMRESQHRDAQFVAGEMLGRDGSSSAQAHTVMPLVVRRLELPRSERYADVPRQQSLPNVLARWWSIAADPDCAVLAVRLDAEVSTASEFAGTDANHHVRLLAWMDASSTVIEVPVQFCATAQPIALFGLKEPLSLRLDVARLFAMQHILGRMRPPLTRRDVWVGETIALWYTFRRSQMPLSPMPMGCSVDDLFVPATGLAASAFWEEQLGSGFIIRLLSAGGLDPWELAAEASHRSAESLLCSFFLWALEAALLTADGHSETIVLDHRSAAVFSVPPAARTLSISTQRRAALRVCWVRGGKLAWPALIPVDSVVYVLDVPGGAEDVLIVNTGARERYDGVYHDDSISVHVAWG